MSDLLRLIKKLNVQRKYVFLLILRSPFDALRTWMLAGLMKATFLCLERNDSERLLGVCLIYGLICILLFFYNGTIWSIYAAFCAKAETLLQKLIVEKVMNGSFRKVSSQFGGEWITKLNSDISAAMMMMNGSLNIPHVVVSIINTSLASVLMINSNLFLFGVTWMFLLPHLFVNYRIVLKQMPRLKEESQNAIAESTSAIAPLITEADTILLYDAGDFMLKICEESSRRQMKINMDMHMRKAVSSVILRLFGIGGYLTMVVSGFGFIYNGSMSFSDVVYCLQVRGAIWGGMFMLLSCQNNIRANSICVRRINDALDEPNETT